MAILLNDLGKHGLVYDILPHELPPEAVSLAQNARFVQNEIRKFKGYTEVYSGTTPSHTQAPRWLLPWTAASTIYWIYAGTTKVFRMTAGVLTDITRTASNYNADATNRWTGGILGGVPIVNNNAGDDPQSWNGTANLQDLPNWPAATSCKVMRVHKTFLVALNVTKSGTTFPHMVKWSQPAAPGTVPTSWDETDDTVDAGEVDLAETTGQLVDCLSLGDINVVYKEGSTWGMQDIGGQNIFRFWPIFLNSGLYAIDCMKEFMHKHFVVTRDDVVVHDARTFESVIDARNRRWLFNNISPDYYDRTFVAHNVDEHEMWICFISIGAISPTAADLALVWNYVYNTWSIRELPDCAFLAYGVVDNDALSALTEIWDNDTEVWDSDSQIWDWRSYSPAKNRLLAAGTADTKFYLMDEGDSADSTDVEFKVQRLGLGVVGRSRDGSWTVDLESSKFVRRVYISCESEEAFTVKFGFQDRKGGAVTWQPEVTFTPATDKFVDVMATGRFFCWEISQTGQFSLRLYSIDIDLEVRGKCNF